MFRCVYPILDDGTVRDVVPKEHLLIHHFLPFAQKYKCVGEVSEQPIEAMNQSTKKLDKNNKQPVGSLKASRILDQHNTATLAKQQKM